MNPDGASAGERKVGDMLMGNVTSMRCDADTSYRLSCQGVASPIHACFALCRTTQMLHRQLLPDTHSVARQSRVRKSGTLGRWRRWC